MPRSKSGAVDIQSAQKAANEYAREVFRSTELHLGDFDKAAPAVMHALVEAWAAGYMARVAAETKSFT